MNYLRCVVTEEISGARDIFGDLGALLTNLAHLLELSTFQNVETASRFERALSTAWAHLARDRGGPQLTKDELAELK